MNIEEVFEKYSDEFLKFDSVKDKLHTRPDMCAFLLLDKLLPGEGRDIICGAAHDEIFLDADCDELAKVATEEGIIALVRCGARLDSSSGGLAMFA